VICRAGDVSKKPACGAEKTGWRKAHTVRHDFSHEVEETLKLGEKIRGYICDTAEW